MKNRICLSIAIVFLLCCTPESVSKLSEGSYLNVQAVKDYLPKNYLDASDVIFTNISGDQLQLKTIYKESVSEKMYSAASYEAETFELTLYNPDNLLFQIVITGNSNYSNTGDVVVALNAWLMPFNESGTTWTTIRFVNGLPEVSRFHDFRENIVLNGQEFQDAYISIGKQADVVYDSYSELCINSEYGVIAFRDESNDLWVYDKFVN